MGQTCQQMAPKSIHTCFFLPCPALRKKLFCPILPRPVKKRLPRAMRIPCVVSGTLFIRRSQPKISDFQKLPESDRIKQLLPYLENIGYKMWFLFWAWPSKVQLLHLKSPKVAIFSVKNYCFYYYITSHTITSVFINAFQVLESW